jgi:hypothetical protein
LSNLSWHSVWNNKLNSNIVTAGITSTYHIFFQIFFLPTLYIYWTALLTPCRLVSEKWNFTYKFNMQPTI